MMRTTTEHTLRWHKNWKGAEKYAIGKLPPGGLEPDAQGAGVHNNGNVETKITVRVQVDLNMLCYAKTEDETTWTEMKSNVDRSERISEPR